MFEKVNPCHPDKVADRIAGALVDLAYKKDMTNTFAAQFISGSESGCANTGKRRSRIKG